MEEIPYWQILIVNVFNMKDIDKKMTLDEISDILGEEGWEFEETDHDELHDTVHGHE